MASSLQPKDEPFFCAISIDHLARGCERTLYIDSRRKQKKRTLARNFSTGSASIPNTSSAFCAECFSLPALRRMPHSRLCPPRELDRSTRKGKLSANEWSPVLHGIPLSHSLESSTARPVWLSSLAQPVSSNLALRRTLPDKPAERRSRCDYLHLRIYAGM